MLEFSVQAERSVVGFSPVRALLSTGITSLWHEKARQGLRLIAPDDPACAIGEYDGDRFTTVRPHDRIRALHRRRVVRGFREVAQAWVDQLGPCRVDVVDPHLLDEGSRLFFELLVHQVGGTVKVRCATGAADAAGLLPKTVSERDRRIEYLVSAAAQLHATEADFLYSQAAGYLGTGDAWTAERILRAVVRQRPTTTGWKDLELACAMLGRPLGADSRSRGDDRRPAAGPDGLHGPQLRLEGGWELLEKWSTTAGQIARNAAHSALFAVADRTVFGTYEIINDLTQSRDFFVVLRGGLTIKIHIRDIDTFAIAYIGPQDTAPGIDHSTDRSA
ncbi:hypothetical protein F0344_34820 (plasmid) [Streptomyces finlayi]|uniref:Uncharacterized protein n=1 Tax=Streptomyces finlayi TaxID=67296 RepID=A0A7G7BWB7_9ACTN|nr:DUF6235 family protein [Streptomyces finlayi]QNE79632.1 hypothetical protein F0344_34820 [Streptomyces finlayi]